MAISIASTDFVKIDPATFPAVVAVSRLAGEGLFVEVSWNYASAPSTIDTVTWDPTGDNQAMTKLQAATVPGLNERTAIFWLPNPTSVKTGNISIAYSGASVWYQLVRVRHIAGHDPSLPARSSVLFSGDIGAGATPITNPITSVTGDLVIDTMTVRDNAGNLFAQSGQANVRNDLSDTSHAFLGSTKVGAASVSMGWGSTTTGSTFPYLQFIASIQPAAAPSPIDLAGSAMSGGSTIATGVAGYTAPPAGTTLVAAAMSGGSTIATGAITYAAPTVKVTTDAFTAWGDPTPLASLTVPHTSVSALDGTFIAHFAGAITDSNGKLTLIHGALVSGSSYAVSNWDATGANRGCKIYQAV